jgi:pimeloyl-ACP methyl ester carboxylesterase
MKRYPGCLVILGIVIYLCLASASNARKSSDAEQWVDRSPHSVHWLGVEGVKLQYLDWGGHGQTVVLLGGLGNGPHLYDEIAPRLTSKFRVVALARRAHGKSDAPAHGYDIETLVDDIRKLLDEIGCREAILIGHSFAGVELTEFAIRYPKRARALVYLDAAYDQAETHRVLAKDPSPGSAPQPNDLASFESSKEWFIRTLGIWSPAIEADGRDSNLRPDGTMNMNVPPAEIDKQLFATMIQYHPDYSKVRSPILAFYAAVKEHPELPADLAPEKRLEAQEFWRNEYLRAQTRQIEKLRQEAPGSKVVMLDTQHLCFIRKQDEDAIVSELLRFIVP